MHSKQLYLWPLLSLAGGYLPAAHATLPCEAAHYSLANRQIRFPILAVETYFPFDNTATGQYTLCTSKGGAPITLNSDPGYGDFYFSSSQVLNCSDQIIEAADKCYPTYSAEDLNLTFPIIRVPWAIMLPDGKQIATETFCYQATLAKNLLSSRFNLTNAEPITCP